MCFEFIPISNMYVLKKLKEEQSSTSWIFKWYIKLVKIHKSCFISYEISTNNCTRQYCTKNKNW